LQVLKFSFKQDRLRRAIQELISTGKIEKLDELLSNAVETIS